MVTTTDWEEVVLDGMIRTRHTISSDNEKLLDENQTHIINHIKEHRDKLSFESIFEAFTEIGVAPALMYDDNGQFAVSDCGLTTVKKVNSQIVAGHEMISYVEADENLWRPSVRAALNAYIDKF